MFHYLPVPLKFGNGTIAFWSTQPAEQLLIFVHGFRGHSTGTWGDFPSLLLHHPKFAGTDIAFYGYRSAKTPAPNSAASLLGFLDSMNQSPSQLVARSLPASAHKRRKEFAYRRVFIIAHSLGAALLRRAIIDAHRMSHPWVKKTRIVLFAPAHRGADLSELAKTGFGPSFALRLYWPVLKDLQPNGPFIRELISAYEAALGIDMSPYLIAAKVITAETDLVVNTDYFCADPPNIPLPRSHSAVCKPVPSFHDPFEHVEAVVT